MDHRLLPKLDDLDGKSALASLRANHDGPNGDAGEALSDMAKAAVHLSVDLSKHGLRELALSLRDTGFDIDGWRFETLQLPSRLDLGFTMSKDGSGYLVRTKLYPDMTDEANGKMEAFHRQRWQRLAEAKAEQNLEGEDYESAKWKIVFTDRIPEEDAIKKDPSSYKAAEDCPHVHEVLCVAFSTNGMPPEGRSVGECPTLKEILASGLDVYQPSKIFEIRPEMSFDRGWAKHPSLPPMADVRDFEAALQSLLIAGEGMRAAGLMSKVSDFASSRRNTQYEFIGDEQSSPIIEFAAASVVPEGIVTGRTVDAMASLWHLTAALDATDALQDILSVVEILSANGHTSSAQHYDCNDWDDFCWTEKADGGEVSIWLQGQNGEYRIDLLPSEGVLDLLRLSRVSAREYRGGSASAKPDARLICEFQSSPDGLMPHAFEEMTMRRIRDVNNILFSLRSVACCLEDDYSGTDPATRA